MTTSYLSAEQICFFRTQGYLAVDGILSPAQLAQARQIVDEFVEQSRSVTENNATYDLEPTHSADQPQLRRLKDPVSKHEFFADLMRSDAVLGPITALLGPNLRYHHSKLNMKAAGVGSPVEWHQDFAFFPHTNDDLVAVGIALDDCDLDNGCLLVIPGSHRGPLLDHHQDEVFIGGVPGDWPEVDMSRAVPVVVKAGGMSIHHVRTLHASAPNLSGKSRRLLIFQYAAADSWPLTADIKMDDFRARIVRGEYTRKARMIELDYDMPHKDGTPGSIFELQEKLNKPAFARETP